MILPNTISQGNVENFDEFFVAKITNNLVEALIDPGPAIGKLCLQSFNVPLAAITQDGIAQPTRFDRVADRAIVMREVGRAVFWRWTDDVHPAQAKGAQKPRQ